MARAARLQRQLGYPRRAEREADQPAHRRQLAGDRSLGEAARLPSRAGGAELGGEEREQAAVNLLQRRVLPAQEVGELLQVGTVGAPGRFRERGRVEEAVDRAVQLHFRLIRRLDRRPCSRASPPPPPDSILSRKDARDCAGSVPKPELPASYRARPLEVRPASPRPPTGRRTCIGEKTHLSVSTLCPNRT